MAIAASSPVTVLADTTDNSTYSLGAFTPAANATLVLMLYSTGTILPGTVAGGSLTWTNKTDFSPVGGFAGQVFWANTGASPGSTTIVWTPGDALCTGCIMQVIQFTGSDVVRADPIRQVATNSDIVGSANPNATFGAALLTTSGYFAGFGNLTNPGGGTVPSTWTSAGDTGYDTPSAGGSFAYKATGLTGTTVTFTAASSQWGMIAVEVYQLNTIAISENLAFSDTPLRSCNLFRALTDAVAFRDVQFYKPNYKTFDAEKLALRTNEPLRQVIFQRAIAETCGFTDNNIQRLCTYLRQLSETAAFQDTNFQRVTEYFRQLAETLALSDLFVDRIVGFSISIAETLAFRTNEPIRRAEIFRALSEALGFGGEQFARACTLFRQISDICGFRDSITDTDGGQTGGDPAFYRPLTIDQQDALSLAVDELDKLLLSVEGQDVLPNSVDERMG